MRTGFSDVDQVRLGVPDSQPRARTANGRSMKTEFEA